jgi:hypothetical protein
MDRRISVCILAMRTGTAARRKVPRDRRGFSTVWHRVITDEPLPILPTRRGRSPRIPLTTLLAALIFHVMQDVGTLAEHFFELTGQAIVRRFANLDPLEIPAVLVRGHGPVCWASSARAAADLAVILEEVACTAWHTVTLNADVRPLVSALRDTHFFRKHGPRAYYGQE